MNEYTRIAGETLAEVHAHLGHLGEGTLGELAAIAAQRIEDLTDRLEDAERRTGEARAELERVRGEFEARRIEARTALGNALHALHP